MEIKDVIEKIDESLNDYSMPRRIKNILASIKTELMKDGSDKAVRISSAIYMIEEVSNDVNIPMHAKTTLWDIVSNLEALKK